MVILYFIIFLLLLLIYNVIFLIYKYISPGFLRNRDLGDVIGGGVGDNNQNIK